MKKRHYIGIRTKIVLYTILCVVAVGLVSNLFLYQYMQHIIEDKMENIDNLSANTIGAQLDYVLEQVQNLSFYCANSPEVTKVLQSGSLESLSSRMDAIEAQNIMGSYLRTSPIDSYINKLFIFNERGAIVHAVSTYSGTQLDYANVMASERYREWKEGRWQAFGRVDSSLNPGGPDCFVLWASVYPVSSSGAIGSVYVEVDTRAITDILSAYEQINRYLVRTEYGDCLLPTGDGEFLAAYEQMKEPQDGFHYRDSLYTVRSYPLQNAALTLNSCINQTALKASNQDVLFSVCTVTLMILAIAVAVLVLLTHYITTPISRIMKKINKISLNDYSFDPELERPNNEMGEVGAQLNQLGLGIENLLADTIAMHDERAEIEMALLQSQVNPHFLYNTLNSVHYMAVVQKNPGIEKLVRSLVNLLKNVSKGVSDKIPLSGELALLDDYIGIQSIRYIGAFDYVCKVPAELLEYKIIKFTLQPLVENAIFHGVVPKGTFGTITVDAYEEERFLVITVTDDGVGMTPEEARALLKMEGRVDKSSLSGIGVANVNRRLKLAYGRDAGLSIESVKGEYTKVSVRIAKELE